MEVIYGGHISRSYNYILYKWVARPIVINSIIIFYYKNHYLYYLRSYNLSWKLKSKSCYEWPPIADNQEMFLTITNRTWHLLIYLSDTCTPLPDTFWSLSDKWSLLRLRTRYSEWSRDTSDGRSRTRLRDQWRHSSTRCNHSYDRCIAIEGAFDHTMPFSWW